MIFALAYRRRKEGAKFIRSNADWAIELLLSASVEQFGGRKEWRDSDPKAIDEWCDASVQFLRDMFGENCVYATLHLDEQSPHLHAFVCPITRDGRLAANDPEFIGGGRTRLREIQDLYYSYMKPLGLDRGKPKKGKKPDYNDIERFQDKVSDFNEADKILDERESELKNRSAAINGQVAEIQKSLDELRRLRLELEEEKRSLQSEKEVAAVSLETARLELEEVRRAIVADQDAIADLRLQLSSVQKQLDVDRNELEQTQAAIDGLNKQAADKRSELESLGQATQQKRDVTSKLIRDNRREQARDLFRAARLGGLEQLQQKGYRFHQSNDQQWYAFYEKTLIAIEPEIGKAKPTKAFSKTHHNDAIVVLDMVRGQLDTKIEQKKQHGR